MDYLTFIRRTMPQHFRTQELQFLVSGNDRLIRESILHDVIRSCREREERLMIVDDTGAAASVYPEILRSFGYQAVNGMSGEFCLYQPFQLTTVKGISKIRQMLATLEYNEKQKGKLLSYLGFIRHVETLRHGGRDFELDPGTLAEYSTVIAAEEKLQELAEAGILDARQQRLLLAKYAECASAAADFEDMLYILYPFIHGRDIRTEVLRNQALIFPTGELGEDETIRSLVMQLLQFGLEEDRSRRITLLILDKGYGSRRCVLNLLKAVPPHVQMHIFSEDIFTLCDAATLAMVLNRFAVRVYSRHLAMSSAEAIEKACGEIDVVKTTYDVTYDRRWRSNRPWDILLGNNKTETYGTAPPEREPKYRREMIMSFPPGNGIVEFMGNTSVFSF